jgi:tellurite resistance protein TerC
MTSTSLFESISILEIFAFLIPFIVAVIIDIKSHKPGEEITMKNAAMWSGIWVVCAAIFGAFIYFERGGEAASLYASGYILEKALAIDNLFAFYLIFKSFGLTQPNTQHHQHPILYWGILGAIIFRVFFLGMGAIIVNFSPFVLIAFSAIILWTVYKMWKSGESDEEVDYTKHWSVNMVKRFTKVNPDISTGKFFVNGATPLFLCLVCIEICDLVFAFDSMPVIIAVVRDPFLMITSSLWAAAGLRSLYFLLVAAQNKFWALDKAVMLLLVFVACKLIGNGLGYHLSNVISLSVVSTILTGGVLVSLFMKEPKEA